MWQRFTEAARKVVFYGQEETQRLRHPNVEPEFLLLGILREPDHPASQILIQLGISLSLLRDAVEKRLAPGAHSPSLDMTLMPRSKRAIDYAYHESRSLNHNYIGTEHLLLGLIREGGGANGEVFSGFHLELEVVRQAVILLQDGRPLTVLKEPDLPQVELEREQPVERQNPSAGQEVTERGNKGSALNEEPPGVGPGWVGPPQLWQKLSAHARKAVFLAQAEAQAGGDDYVSTEHLLLGVIHESDNRAAKVLERLGVNRDRIREEIERGLPQGVPKTGHDLTLTPRFKRVIDLAYDEACSLNEDTIGTEHLLIGLIREGEGLAARVLDKVGLELEGTRRAVAQIPKQASVPEGKPTRLWDRFTEHARRAIYFAQEEAQRVGHDYVGTEHLLLGLLRESGGTSTRVLERLGIDPNLIRAETEGQLREGGPIPGQEITLTPRGKRVIDCAYAEAQSLNNDYVGTEHLLLGLLREGEGLAGRVLIKLGLELEAVRQVVASVQEEKRTEPS